MQDLGTLGGFDAYGYGINAGGQVVGYSKITGNPTSHAYRTTASVAGSDAPS